MNNSENRSTDTKCGEWYSVRDELHLILITGKTLPDYPGILSRNRNRILYSPQNQIIRPLFSDHPVHIIHIDNGCTVTTDKSRMSKKLLLRLLKGFPYYLLLDGIIAGRK